MSQDLDQLRLLSIFHFVVGGIAALFSCIPFIHFFLGLAMTTGWLQDVDPAGQVFGIFFMVFAGLFILAGWAFAICVITAGRCLAARRRYMFCLVMAAVECIFMPFGTVLGVLTIVVLNRPSVKRLFGVEPESTVAPEAGS